jgi:hypothetical protein
MKNSNRQLALSSVLVLLLYLVPNLVQDVHRVWGHHDHSVSFQSRSIVQFQNHSEKCPICFFEFNVVDEINAFVYIPVLPTTVSMFVDQFVNQVQNKTFHYYNLRAPPRA